MTFETIRGLIMEQLGCEEALVTMEASLTDDLGADSLAAVELSMAIEDEFGVTISDEDLPELKTVGDLVNYVDNHRD